MTERPQYTGTLRKGAEQNTIEGELVDWFGWHLHIIGTRNTDGTYTLHATVGDKGKLRIPLVDGPE